MSETIEALARKLRKDSLSALHLTLEIRRDIVLRQIELLEQTGKFTKAQAEELRGRLK